MVVHVDKVKQCLGETPTSWLGTESYNALPTAMEPDVIPNMFGGVDRSGVATFNDDGEINVVLRPKRNAGVPARFLSRIYTVYKDAPSDVYNHITFECVNNIDGLCLSRFSNMKRTTKKVETFEYKCFQCLKQDDKARCYTRSYDLILHTVNTHRKFPVDARHNTYYTADGSDLRDATGEEVENYKLAASHKRRKPESSCDKSESATVMTDIKKTETTRAAKSEERKRSGHSSREREDENHRKNEKKRTSSRGSKDERTPSRGSKDKRTLSKEPKSERNASRESQKGRDTGHRGSGDGASGRSAERNRQTTRVSTAEMDDDERDRRKLAEIIKRMDERKLTK